ncbi:hypothetical protein KSS87_006908, partial [Heliosperma pusillum]
QRRIVKDKCTRFSRRHRSCCCWCTLSATCCLCLRGHGCRGLHVVCCLYLDAGLTY